MKKNITIIASLFLLFGNFIYGQSQITVETKNGDIRIFSKPCFSCDSDLGRREFEIGGSIILLIFVDGISTNKIEIPYSSIDVIDFLYYDNFKDVPGKIAYVNVTTKSGKKYSGGYGFGYCDFVGYDSDGIKNTFNMQTVKRITFK